MSDIKTVQLTDKDGNAISPFTPLSAVYYAYGEQGNKKLVNMETQFGSMDIERINNTHEEAIDSIITLSGESIEYVTQNKNFYDDGIYALSGKTQELYDKTWPYSINLTLNRTNNYNKYSLSYTVSESGASFNWAYEVYTYLKHNGQDVVSGDTRQNDRTETYTGTTSPYGYDHAYSECSRINTNEIYKKKSKTSDIYRYLCLYGKAGEDLNGEQAKSLTKEYTQNFSAATINGITQNQQYVWLLVPAPTTITKITSNGFEFTYDSKGELTIDDATYHAYRCKEALKVGTDWTLSITHSKRNVGL